ncbi:hypothetical protein [Pelagovum pacificum]|uniref:GlsB/YeaQ/YmgE family stress response membrane protein n=1 Tax=Pelagovum pacificum TaxID=2588711 RepID=A0A5C5GHE3_9RHOB|nr:hypothetical protein [Pelagovum pacificum]QQA42654.1 hypothetical protein I8N54_18040 [Pelagovum pacificum]TNY34195.1 hypothetical protein FHY64_13350 [Pelagovum pacificum]
MGPILAIIAGGAVGWFTSLVTGDRSETVLNTVLGIMAGLVCCALLRVFGVPADSAYLLKIIIAALGAAALIWSVRRLGA